MNYQPNFKLQPLFFAHAGKIIALSMALALSLGAGGCRVSNSTDHTASNGGSQDGGSQGTLRSGGAPSLEVHFSPRGGCQEALLREIGAARRSIWVQAFSFTSAPIEDALLKAHKRGVQVRIILDKGQETPRYTGATFMQNGGVAVLIDHKHAIAHNKIMIFDGQTIATGSFNFTKSAENSNAENLLIIKSAPDLVRRYQDNFETHAAHSTPYQRRDDTSANSAGNATDERP